MPGGQMPGSLPGQQVGRQHVALEVEHEAADVPAEPLAPVESRAAELRITTLGDFGVWSARVVPDGVPRWGRNDGRKLLKCLLAAPAFRRTREQIMELLWPDHEPGAARAALRHALSRLRRTLDPRPTERASARYVGSDRDAIWLQCGPASSLAPAPVPVSANVPTDARRESSLLWIDRRQFEREAESALAACALARDDASMELATRCARSALQLYRGVFLPNDLYVDWTRPARERCQHLWASLVRRLSVLLALRDREYEQATLLLEQVVAALPDDEQAVTLFMLVPAAGGHRGEALRSSEALRQRLAERFSMQPSDAVETVASSVRAGDVRRGLHALLAAEVGAWGTGGAQEAAGPGTGAGDPEDVPRDLTLFELRELAHDGSSIQ